MPSVRRPPPLTSVLAALALIAGCPSTDPGRDADRDSQADLDCGDRLVAEVRVPGGGYRALALAGDGVELVLGFQGFRYVYLRARLDVDPHLLAADAVVQLDGNSPRSQPVQLAFAPDGAGVVSAPMQIFFNDDPLPSLIDHGVRLDLRLGARCTTGGHTRLRYDPSCYEGPDGQPVCGDRDGAPDGGL